METGQTDSRQTYTGRNFLCILFGFYTNFILIDKKTAYVYFQSNLKEQWTLIDFNVLIKKGKLKETNKYSLNVFFI